MGHESRRALRLALATALAVAAANTGCPIARKDVTPRPNILMLIVDTVRADHLGMYGYPRGTSPALDALARDAVVYERAVSPAPWTVPAIGSLLTSTYPSRHGAGARLATDASDEATGALRLSSLGRMHAAMPGLADLLAERGWSTHAILANPLLADFGLFDGFDRIDPGETFRRASEVSDAAISTIRARGDDPFLLLAHYFDPHAPYAPQSPDPEDVVREHAERAGLSLSRSRAVLNYDQEIREMDREIGRLLDALRDEELYGETLIVLVSDHGEEFWERHDSEKRIGPTVTVPNPHGHTLYQELLHVPLIVKYPGSKGAGTRVPVPTSGVDVLPTLLDWLQLPAPVHVQGRSLLRDAGELDDRAVLAEFLIFSNERKASVQGTMKYVLDTRTGSESFYDLGRDPGESNDIGASLPQARKTQLRRQLAGLIADSSTQAPPGVDASTMEQMKALGYVDPTPEPPRH